MIQFLTLTSTIPLELEQIIDLKNPLDDLRWKDMTNVIYFKKNEIIYKIQFVIDIIPFETLYDVMLYVSKIYIENNIIIQVIYIQKPEPPLHPSVLFELHPSVLVDEVLRYNNNDNIPYEPISFIKWYALEENLKHFIHKLEYPNYRYNDTIKFSFASKYTEFNNLNEALLYSIHHYILYDSKNIKYNRFGNVVADIKMGIDIHRQNIYSRIEDIEYVKKEIYTYLLSIPEWFEYFDSWRKFWSKDIVEPDFSELYSNFESIFLEF
jgi:hypothetical protein